MDSTDVLVTIKTDTKNIPIETKTGKNLLDVLSRVYDFHIDASCGGKGTCGKCRVCIPEGNSAEVQEAEKRFLSPAEMKKGIRLACQFTIGENTTVELDGANRRAQIREDHTSVLFDFDPVVKKQYLSLTEPVITDQRDDLTRLCDKLNIKDIYIPLSVKRELPSLLRNSDFSVTAVYSGSRLIAVEKGDTTDINYGIAVDVGTTTVVAHLLDFTEGKVIDTVSGLNKQKVMGADVISRIDYCIKNSDGLEKLQNKILTQIGEMSLTLLDRNGIDKAALYSIVFAGNTTMLHLLAAINPAGIAEAPFIPGFLGKMTHLSKEVGDFPLNCMFSFIPSISGYVGGDIVAGILASKMYEREELSILIDVGTNGEIVLGNREKLYCCSTAAGPAFEGAHISCGMGGVEGALDTVRIDEGVVHCTTIGNGKPAGICGSGIIDAAAALRTSGVVDFTGRICTADEAETDNAKRILETRLVDKDGPAILLVGADKSETGEAIVFTQRDVREVQLAKAAIAAGAATLLHEAGKSLDDIAHLFIAGGFGSYISGESAAAIGLIPAALLDRTEFIGNTSGQGAVACSFSQKQFDQCKNIVALATYVELSSNTFFQGKYMEDMIFPEV